MANSNAINSPLLGTTGTGNFVGSTSPTLTTPNLGTPASGTLTNCTGLPVGTGLATGTASATLLTNSSGVPAWSASMTNGQVLVGSTGASPAPATLTAGTNISIANAANSITISATGLAGIGWVTVTGTSQTMAADTGYIANNASLVTLTLPTTAAVGTIIYIQGLGAGGWKVAQNAGQNIQAGSVSTTAGTGGSLASTNQYDSVTLLCVVANTTWTFLGGPQSGGLTTV